ncbi:MAG: hypothetical protein NTV57_06380 [Cyanobacteria bacterium]|nr:hypothetical protein [Cyanobacteriota bacterium]
MLILAAQGECLAVIAEATELWLWGLGFRPDAALGTDVPILGFHHAKEVLPLLIDEQKVCLQPVKWRLSTTFVILPSNHHSLSKRKWKDFSICSRDSVF